MDIVVASPKDVAETEDDPLFVTHDAKVEGRVLYEAKGQERAGRMRDEPGLPRDPRAHGTAARGPAGTPRRGD